MCGNCCSGPPGFIWLDGQEQQRLAEHLGLTVVEMLRKYCRKIDGRVSLKEVRTREGNHDCIFLKELPAEKGDGQAVQHPRRVCGIYPVRPLQCRTWPFWDGMMATRDQWEHATRRCPGINRGRHYTAAEVEALRDAKDWP